MEVRLPPNSQAKNAPDDGALTNAEIKRYGRQLLLPDFGVEAQQRLRASSVLVVGAGGLGSSQCGWVLGAAAAAPVHTADQRAAPAAALRRSSGESNCAR